MSRRVSFSSTITDKGLAIEALNALKLDFESDDKNQSIRVTSGKLRGASINLKTGEVVSDSDYGHTSTLAGLTQAYSEAEFLQQAVRTGSTIEERRVDVKTGNIHIKCRMVG